MLKIGFTKASDPSTRGEKITDSVSLLLMLVGYLDLVLQGIALSALTSAVINLIPSSAITEKGESPNDGLGIIYSLFGRRG